MIEAERYYRVLDLDPGATQEEVHQGYLDLTWVWHPDRFTGHPRLQQKAHCKLQELNEAHARLRLSRPACHKKDSPTKAQATPSVSPKPNPTDGLSKPRDTQAAKAYEQPFQPVKPQVRNSRDVGEWLD